MTARERIRRAIADYWDLVLAGAAASVATLLGMLGEVQIDTLTTACLGVLAALAGVIFRERLERRKTLDEMTLLENTARSDKPWHVVKETLSWDLANARDATSKSEKEIRFLHAQTVSVWEFCLVPGGGTVVRFACTGGPVGQTQRDWPVMNQTFVDNGRRYHVVSTNGIWRRDDRAIWTSNRELQDFFPDTTESVAKVVLMPTDELAMQVTWPVDHAPTRVCLSRGDDEKRFLTARTSAAGRAYVAETFVSPRIGEKIAIEWDWAP